MDTGFRIERIDHLVLTVQDIAASAAFYLRVLGMRVVTFGDGRTALAFGNQKINLHQVGAEFEPKAACPSPGSADLCFIVSTSLEPVIAHLAGCGVEMEEGPVPRTGAAGPMNSIYIRDPDGNLVEVASYA